ncbi:low-affinity inorganic phosphate transporter [Salmonella enterica subsp. enterica]|uniref:Low-affinity inorganic phosphate transporter n=1 Tax=Salmonella enterica I TaxID=59201 RepID=A0A447N2E0_SALET|nr:low-affinity inorganic phosphate transporter [Salmonella enterica subsp. enterica]
MTYAQGMSAQMTAAVSIGLASYTGMPVFYHSRTLLFSGGNPWSLMAAGCSVKP